MNPEGLGRLFVPLAGWRTVVPEHYEPVESPLINRSIPSSQQPGGKEIQNDMDKYGR